jgi:ferric-dicitrate binding protein FerR (iron transport regulator)
MNKRLLGYVGLLSLIAGCMSSPPSSIHEVGHAPPRLGSGTPQTLHFDGETVAQAAQRFNRYNRRKIVIDDPAIASLKVGGIFVRTDPESFARALGLTRGIQMTIVGVGDNRTIRLSGAETGS